MTTRTKESLVIALAISGGVILEVVELALKVAFVAAVIFVGAHIVGVL